MGFGIIFIGVALLLFEVLGIDFLGYITICYGCFLLSQHFKSVKFSFYASAATAVAATVRSASRYGLFELKTLYLAIIEVILYAGLMLIMIFICLSVARFAEENKEFRLRSFSNVSWYAVSLYSLLGILLVIFSAAEFSRYFTAFIFVYKYLMLLLFAVYFWYCFASISTPRLLAKEEKENLEYEEKEQNRRKKIRKLMGKNEEDSDEKH